MSRASEWARRYTEYDAKVEKLREEVFGEWERDRPAFKVRSMGVERSVACVAYDDDRDVRCDISGVLQPRDALALAHWILATFGDEPEKPRSQER